MNPEEKQPTSELELAFLLLCQAKKACGEKDSVQMSGTRFTIHAPKNIDEWIHALGGTSTADIDRITSMLGPQKSHLAKEVLTAAITNNQQELQKSISKFLNLGYSAATLETAAETYFIRI